MSLSEKTDYKINEDDYLKNELVSTVKHEYVDGYVYAMAGASEKHNLISGNVFRELSNALKQKKSQCHTFIADMKVKISHADKQFFYPDVMVVCDEEDNENEYFKNSPIIIVEVLSQTTRKMDSSTKRISYFNITSLEEYVLIEQEFCQVQVFKRQDQWQSRFYFLGDSITFTSLNISLSVADIYYQIKNQDMMTFLQDQVDK
jgi:Uma2 family endonuclease